MECPDQCWLPHILPIAKDHARLEKMPLPAIGIINFSQQTQHYLYHLPVYKRNPNLYITAQFLQIQSVLSGMAPSTRPHTLWCQLDNYAKENKNRWFFGFASLLVHWKWFKCVQISFLPPGHSYNIVDQMFSTGAIILTCKSAFSIPSLVSLVDKAYIKETTKPGQSFLPCVFNWSGWMGPYMPDLEGHSSLLVFLF